MNHLHENTTSNNIPWFRRWFDSTYYHKLYAHRNDNEAHNFIDELIYELQPSFDSSMIDVGCGTGRHSKYLAEKGFEVTGIDLAFSNIKEAKRSESKLLHFSRHDMRIPFGKESYNYVFNFFTSFGYFKNESEHAIVIRNMSDALKPGGVLVLDYLNTTYAEKQLVATEKREIDGIAYDITRWSDEKHIYKKISVADRDIPGTFEHMEKVAKFRLRDFDEMFSASHLQLQKIYGDYSLNEYHSDESPRLIMIAGKT
ncbi:MAG: methyltransferase domain-containing protein [Chitinophagaceae bacterium]|nr:methyltransferase domain-containing protein [Chitinophagaceae bacterium]